MSRWSIVRAAGEGGPAPADMDGAVDGAMVGADRGGYVLRRGWRFVGTGGGRPLWEMLVALEGAAVDAARPVWLAHSALGWMLLARVPPSCRPWDEVLAPAATGSARPAHRERRRILDLARDLVAAAARAWPGVDPGSADVALAGWPGQLRPILAGPRVPKRAARPGVTLARARGLSRADVARLFRRTDGAPLGRALAAHRQPRREARS